MGQYYSLYPNPSAGYITLTQLTQDSGVVQLNVSDILGKSIFEKEVTFHEKAYKLDLNRLAAGMYFTSVIDSNGRRFIFKFVKE